MNLRDRIDRQLTRLDYRHVNWGLATAAVLVVMTALVGGLAAAIVYTLAGLFILGVICLATMAALAAHEALLKWVERLRVRAQDRIERRAYQRSRQTR